MAEDAVDAAIKSGKLKAQNGCVTDQLRIAGAYGWDPVSFTVLAQNYIRMKQTKGKVIPGAMDTAISKHLSHAYGSASEHVAAIAQVHFFWHSQTKQAVSEWDLCIIVIYCYMFACCD